MIQKGLITLRIQIGIACLLLTLVMSVDAQQTNVMTLTGPYLGQKPPGDIPEIFAPGIVSTELHDDGSPVFTPNGQEVYFRINGRIDGKARGVIFTMKQIHGYWSEPQIASFSGKYMDGGVLCSPEGDRLFWTSNRPINIGDSTTPKPNSWYIEKTNDHWLEPKLSGLSGYSFAANGNLYFARKIENGIGDFDLYRMVSEDGTYREPVNLGPEVNSIGWDQGPAIAPDESYLVFCSIRDSIPALYATFLSSDGQWLKPLKLNERINKDGSMWPLISFDGKYLFFVSHRRTPSTNPKKMWSSNIFRGQQVDWGADIYWVSTKIIEELRPKE